MTRESGRSMWEEEMNVPHEENAPSANGDEDADNEHDLCAICSASFVTRTPGSVDNRDGCGYLWLLLVMLLVHNRRGDHLLANANHRRLVLTNRRLAR